MLEFLLGNLVVLAALMTVLWAVSVVVHDASIVDIAWGPAFVAIVWSQYARAWLLQGPACLPEQCGGDAYPPATALIVPLLVSAWGLRLAIHLAWRNLGRGEDFRYARMRERWGARFPLISLVVVFLLQAVLAWVVSLPAQVATDRLDPAAPLAVAGFLLFAAGLAFETVGDLQLAEFKRDPANAGRVMDRGLWRYTRHPNYFGDCCVWWGIFLIAASIGEYWTILGPIVMTVLLVRVSGAALLERTIGDRRPGYADYVRRTSGFIPRPPRD